MPQLMVQGVLYGAAIAALVVVALGAIRLFLDWEFGYFRGRAR